MNKLKFIHEWAAAGNDAPEYRDTMAMLALHVDHVNLMKNEDIWSKSIRESVLMSAYPLAMWLASSWWRLNREPLPAVHGARPSIDWRMAHELGAANHGFVWPRIIFASDGEAMQVWANASNTDDQQSVIYLNGLDKPASIPLTEFQRCIEEFITTVINRLDVMKHRNTDLSELWQIIQEESADPQSLQYRRLEAEMGYDPDECPDELISKALKLKEKTGAATLSELAPIYGKSAMQEPLFAIEEIADIPGPIGAPTVQLQRHEKSGSESVPWKRAIATAEALRKALDNPRGLIDDGTLCDLLGLKSSEVEACSPSAKFKDAGIAVTVPGSKNRFKFISRKKHPMAKRFELARFLGDYILAGQAQGGWLASTDLATSRQKSQRAFAAAFLCPIDALQDFLQGDYSEDAYLDASEHFQVSSKTIESTLANNGLIPFMDDYAETRLPYY